MATNEELRSFVKDGLARGVPRPELEDVLGQAGWSASDVHGALTSFANVQFPIPVPRPQPYLSARDAFMYLLMFTTLYAERLQPGPADIRVHQSSVPRPRSRFLLDGVHPRDHTLVGVVSCCGLSGVLRRLTLDRS